MPSIRQEEFLSLPFKAKLEFLYGLPARQKRDLILSAPEAERLVQSFSPETLFYTVKEIGSADSGELLSLAVPEQIQGLFDLDCWTRDRPNLDRMREWIEALTEAGRQRMAEGLMGLDMEMLALLLRQYFRVHRLDDPLTAADVPSDRFLQFDEHYIIEFQHHDAILQPLVDFLEEVFERDYTYFATLMEEIYWSVETELEEEAYQFRRARLNDRGFPDFFEAQDVFAYVNPHDFLKIRAGYTAPTRADLLRDDEVVPHQMAPVLGDTDLSLFNTALMAGFAAQGQRQLRSEMALVSNQVLVASAVDFGDLEAVRVAVEMTHHYLNLGLENLAGGDLDNAIEHLRDTHLKLLFRLGVSLTIDLRKRAEQITAALGLDPARVKEISYLDSPYREALAGFLERRPRFFEGLSGSGSVAMRDFGAMRDVHLGHAVLDQIEAMRDLFQTLLAINIAASAFRAETAGREIRLGQILITAFARAALDRKPDQRLTPAPIESSRLGELYMAIMTPGGRPARLTEGFRRQVEAALAARVDSATLARSAGFVASCLSVLEEDLAELDPRAIDPRFLRSLLIRRG
ncbi:MAG TPA: DUF6178 family protein [Candidatus Binataceae bacterium]|jgi:hypothetical protein|nr:DUF6178 family protein [Candidatus Binataceae bacterium]